MNSQSVQTIQQGAPRYSTAQVGDLSIHYDLSDYRDPWREEAPQTLLLYPGYCRNVEFWRAWVPLLGREYRILRMDARGYGYTSKPPEGSPLNIDQLAGDALGLMDALGLERVHWVGESTGGAVGMWAALTHPDRIASITLCNTTARMRNETHGKYAVGEADQESALRKFGVEAWCKMTLAGRMDLSNAPPGLGDWVAREMARTPVHIAIAAFKLFSTIDLFPELGRIQAPVLQVVGNKCAESRKKLVEEMRDAFPHAKLVYVDGVDNGIHFLAPDLVTAEVRAFLQENFSG